MKIMIRKMTVLVVIILLNVSFGFAQDESMKIFGKEIFRIVQNNDKEGLMKIFPSSNDINILAASYKENATPPTEKTLEEIKSRFKSKIIVKGWKKATDAIDMIKKQAIDKNSVIWNSASYKKIKVISTSYNNGLNRGVFVIYYEFMGMEYQIKVKEAVNVENKWKITKFDLVGVKEEINESTKKYSKMNILKFYIYTIPSTKKDGKAWDNSFGQYLPDIYARIENKNSVLFNTGTGSRIENAKASNLPRGWDITREPFIIHNSNFDKDYWICLKDYDSSTDDDNIGCVNLKVNNYKGEKEFYIEQKGIKIKLIVEWIE